MRSDDTDGRAKEEARRQWVRELDEQRKMQRAKVEDEKQRLNTQASGSFFTGGVSASTNSSSVTGARRRNLSEIHKQSTNHGSSTPEHMHVSQVQHTSHHVDKVPDAVPSNQKHRASHADPTPPTHSPPSTHVANFGRMRNQFIDSGLTADADKKKRDADVWREQLQIQIEEKKQRQILEKKQSEDFVYQSWSEMQRPGSQGGGGGKSGLGGNSNSVTGMPVRRSMHTIQRDEETLNRQSVPGLETDSGHRSARQANLPPPSPKRGMKNDHHAAPAAESFSSPPQVFASSNLSKIPRAVRKSISIPKPEHNPLDWGEDAEQHDSADNFATHSSPPTRNHPNEPKSQNRNVTNSTINNPSEPRGQQQQTSMNRNRSIDHSTEELHERMRNVSLNASIRTPSPPSSPPLPAQQLHNQNNSSPNRKLSKILGSVKASLGYPAAVPEQPARAQKRNPSNQPTQSSSTNKPPRVRSAFGRTLPPAPSTQPANTSSIPTRELNRNKKLPSIKSDKSGARVNKALLQKEMQHRDAVVAKAQQLYQQQQRNHISALHSMTHRAENHDAEIADTYMDNGRKPTQKNQQEGVTKNASRKETSNRNDFIEKPSDDVLVAAGTSTGRGRKGEFTPHGSLRPPWGISAAEEAEYVKEKNITTSVAKKGGDGGGGKVVRPPWGIEEDVPMRVVGRERRPKASSGAVPAGVDEEVLRMKALNELSRFGSLLAEEKRALSWDMGM